MFSNEAKRLRTLPNIYDGTTAPSDRAIQVHRQPIRNIQTVIQILDDDDSIIDTIAGKATSGSLSVAANSLTRRTGIISLIVDPDYMPDKNTIIWYGKRFRIYQGIVDMSMRPHEYVNFLLGTFVVDEGTLRRGNGSDNIEIRLSDKMTKYDADTLEHELKIPRGTPVSQAIRSVMELVGETDFGYIAESSEKEIVPYDYTKPVGTNIVDIVKELRDMYMDYICGYNLLGQFEYKKVEVQKSDDVKQPVWRFDTTDNARSDLMISFTEAYSLKNIKNRVVVYGATSSKTGYTPHGEVRITDASNKFNVDAIGTRTKIVQNNNLTDDMQCVSQAKYEIWKTAHFQESATITTVPVWFLNADDIITITNPATGEVGRYRIDTISADLSVSGTMSITAHKLYFVELAYGKAETPLVDAIKNGINNLGWLSLGEQRIKDCYGISASGDNTMVVRFIVENIGGEQAAVTGYLTTKKQTLEIDLRDFEKLNFSSEDGDVGRSQGDYADRVMGHEMFHAVCNDYFGTSKTIDMPVWFKEGFAELLHGGKQRYISLTGFIDNDEKKRHLVNLSKQILNGSWNSTSEDYVASYLISAAIYYVLGSKEELQSAFQRLKGSENINLNFLHKMLPQIGKNNDETKNIVLNKLENMDLWDSLNDLSDPDTGSIGGSHMINLYNKPLDSSDVFNNKLAEVPSLGFKLQFDD